MRIFELTKSFPKSEQYSLVDGESWRERQYPAHFVSKLTDADAEASETMVWLDFALNCGTAMSRLINPYSPNTSKLAKC
jgi:hypothetical protein